MDNQDTRENIVATIMQIDVQTAGPVPDDPREAYRRGIEAALLVLIGK